MSIVLAADNLARLVPVVECLQQWGDALEIVIVLTSSGETTTKQLSDARGTRVIHVPQPISLAGARAIGIVAASSPLIFIGETHSFPESGAFEALIDAHATGCTAAVPAFENANPDSAVSWAGFLTGYAPWTPGLPPQNLSKAPTVNVSYRRSFLTTLGSELEYALSSGGNMLEHLRKAGHRIGFVPTSRIKHANNSFLRPWMHQRFLAGRVIGGTRSRLWNPLRRLVHAATSPLIPPLLIGRSRAGIMRTIHGNELPPSVLPIMFLGNALQAAGELLSYLAGNSALATARFDDLEIRMLEFGRADRTSTVGSPPSGPSLA